MGNTMTFKTIVDNMKELRKRAGRRMTPLLRIDFDHQVTFVYAEPEDDTFVEKPFTYRDFETALEKELERLGE